MCETWNMYFLFFVLLKNDKIFIILQYETDYQKVIGATEQISEQQPVYIESMRSAEKTCNIKKLLFYDYGIVMYASLHFRDGQ